MTVQDPHTDGLWAPRDATLPPAEPPTQQFSADPTVVDVYPVTATPVASAAGSGMPPEWTPPTTVIDSGARGEPRGVGKHRAKLAVAGVVVAAVAATAGITAAVVGSDDAGAAASGAAAGGGPGGGQGFAGGGMGQGGRGIGGGVTAAALHGTYVVSDGNGGYVTQETQTGTVSAVSTDSITVKSADGYRKTYVIGSSTTVDNGADTIGDVATGHTVRIVATASGDTATATTVTDTNLATATGTQQGGTGTQPGGTQQDGTQQGGPGGGGPMQGGQAPGDTGGTTTQGGTGT